MDVKHIAKLANLVLKPGEEEKLASQFADTLKTVDLINSLDTTGVEPTSQVTGLTNVLREDVVDTSRVLTQKQALSNSPSAKNGYFVVPAIF